MDEAGRSTAGTQLPGWLAEAGFAAVDPGERPVSFSGGELERQAAYAADVVESTLAGLMEVPGASRSELEAGVAELRALPTRPGAALGWMIHKSRAVR